MSKKILVFTATYNEAENIKSLLISIREYLPHCDLLVIDDNSPDGTGGILKTLQATLPRLAVIERSGKLGLGSAHKVAFAYAVKHGYDALVTMDADFSHHPRYLPEMERLLAQNDFVTGSRYTKGGRCDYGLYRQILSRVANGLARVMLGLRLKETTTAYRGFRRELLSRFDIENLKSEGYSFFVESLYVVQQLTDRVTEFPIYFEDRRAGQTKINKKEILRWGGTLLRLFWARVFFPIRMLNWVRSRL